MSVRSVISDDLRLDHALLMATAQSIVDVLNSSSISYATVGYSLFFLFLYLCLSWTFLLIASISAFMRHAALQMHMTQARYASPCPFQMATTAELCISQ